MPFMPTNHLRRSDIDQPLGVPGLDANGVSLLPSDTNANWNATTPAAGQLIYVSDLEEVRYGDGQTAGGRAFIGGR